MTVYLCYKCYFNGCDEFRSLQKIVASLEQAEIWKEMEYVGISEWCEIEARLVEIDLF